jgi:hypothetical protein
MLRYILRSIGPVVNLFTIVRAFFGTAAIDLFFSRSLVFCRVVSNDYLPDLANNGVRVQYIRPA